MCNDTLQGCVYIQYIYVHTCNHNILCICIISSNIIKYQHEPLVLSTFTWYIITKYSLQLDLYRPNQANVSWAPRPQATGMMYGFPYQHWPKSRLWVVGWIEGWFLYFIIKALGNTSWFFCSFDLAFLWWTIIKEPQGYTCCKDGPQAKQPKTRAFRFEGDLTALGTKQNHSQLITDTTGVSPVIW